MPPQAYTKETLQEAFEWWSEQPEELRNQIQDKDDLVGYFLRVNRGADLPQNDGFTKAAKESFSSELKGLAKNLDAFEGYGATRKAAAMKANQGPAVKTEEVFKQKHVFEPSVQLQFPEMSKPLVPAPEEIEMANVPAATTTRSLAVNGQKSVGHPQFFKLDEKSKSFVAKTREVLNLSSDEEALRAVIALGAAKIKKLI